MPDQNPFNPLDSPPDSNGTTVPTEPLPGQPATAHDVDRLARELAALGAESETERRVKRIVPWVVSVAVHLGLIILGFLVTWTVVMLQQDDDPVVIIADFDALTYDPITKMSDDAAPIAEDVVQDRVETDSLAEAVEDRLEAAIDPMSLLADSASRSELARFAPEPTQARAEFVGLSSTNARRIVYVIDASGSMIGALPIVLDELARSLDGLTQEQAFGVIFFQQNEALIVPPATRLSPGSRAEKLRMLKWIDENVIPSGRSNPLAALEKALSLEPDVIFLLSENITGSGEFEIDQRELLAMLNDLNPVEDGRRRTQINCIQFLDPDPLDTLRKIAEAHGGAKGYKFLDRAELGLKAR